MAQPVVERAQPGGVVEAGRAAVATEDDVVELGDQVAALGERPAAAISDVGDDTGPSSPCS
jgi:hypothetical protein